MAAYLGVLFDRGMAVATAELAVAAVRHRARREGLPDTIGLQTQRALCGFHRQAVGRGTGQVVGITWEQADRMAERAAERGTTGGLRDALLVRIMSDCLLRGAEASALTVADIAFVDDWLRVDIRRSKTDQEGKGVALYAGPATARLARRWLQAAGAADGPLFRHVYKGGKVADATISERSIRNIVKRCAADVGINGRVSSHSLRVGAAQSLRDAGATSPELMAAGSASRRWRTTPASTATSFQLADLAIPGRRPDNVLPWSDTP